MDGGAPAAHSARMCNEYRFKQSLDRVTREFSELRLPLHWAGGAPNLEPRDSIRPTEPAPVVVGAPNGGGPNGGASDGGAELKQLRWGFPPPGKGGPVINFRSEGRRFPQGRCLVLADGFYEFTGEKSPKAKWLFATGEDFFAIAGLVRDGRFTLLTTAPGPDIAPYHDRQIAILPRKDWRAWLGAADAQPAIGPLPAGTLSAERIR